LGSTPRILILLCSALGASSAAHAQANSNAVAQASDGFGFQSGSETVGLYDQSSVRGFNLEAGGNYRVNGTYFVKNSGTSSFFVENTAVRIGHNTLDIPFPGPLGVVDYTLRDPAPHEKSVFTLGLDYFSQPYFEANLRHGSADGSFSYSLGASHVFDVRDEQGGRDGWNWLFAGTARVTRGPFRVQLFGGDYEHEEAGEYRVVPSGTSLPPRVQRGTYFGPAWGRSRGARRIAGVLVDLGANSPLGVGVTSVVSQEDPHRRAAEIFSTPGAGGASAAEEILLPHQPSLAWSTELRAHFQSGGTKLVNRIDLSARARFQGSRFGGGAVVSLGEQPFGEPLAGKPQQPSSIPAALNETHVRQFGLGISDRGRFGQWLRWNVGLLKTDYRNRTQVPGLSAAVSRASPWLYNAGASLRFWRPLELYGSVSRGLEETGVAPVTATNANQLLDPAMVTQKEIGARFTPLAGLSLIAGWFDTKKPYAAVDTSSGDYRFVGEVEHKGLEFSIAGHAIKNFTLVVGGVLIDAQVDRQDVTNVTLRPVAVPRLRISASGEGQIAAIPGLSIDGGFVLASKRAAQSLPTGAGVQLMVPGTTLFNLGMRYSTRIGRQDVILRAQVQNLLDRFAWDADASETLTPIPPRRARVILSTLF